MEDIIAIFVGYFWHSVEIWALPINGLGGDTDCLRRSILDLDFGRGPKLTVFTQVR